MEKKVRDLIINLTLLDPDSAKVVEGLQKEKENLINYIKVLPCDLDITFEQIEAYEKIRDLIETE
jgi:hypothetical protein